MADYTLSARLTADAKNFVDGFDKAEGKIGDLEKKAQSVSGGFKDLGGKLSSLGGSLTKKVTLPALGVVSALAGIAVFKGFQRLVGIDTAKAKLKGLGHSAEEITGIMDSAMASVKGTSYGFADATTIAASAVASGVKEGKELTKYLSLTADASAIAGTSLEEMGGIFNKVTTGQSAMTRELDQLANRGLPVYEWLSEATGKTGADLKKFVSDGKVDTEMFLSLIEDNIGGASQVMGEESFTASIENIGATIGRIGANFLDAGTDGEGFFSTIKPLLVEFMDWLGTLEDKAEEWGVAFGNAFNSVIDWIMKMKGKWDDLSPAIQDIVKKVIIFGGIFAVAIGPILSILGVLSTVFGVIAGVITFLISPIGLVIGAIVLIGLAVMTLWDNFEAFRNFITNMFESFSPLIDMFKDSFATLGESIGPIWEGLKNLFDSLTPILLIIAGVVGGMLAGSWAVLTGVFNAVIMAIGPLIEAIIALFDFVVNFVNMFVALFQGDFAGAWGYIQEMAQSAMDFFVNIFEAIINFVVGFVEGFLGFFKGLADTLGLEIIPELVGKVVEWFGEMYELAISKIKPIIAFFVGIIEGVKGAIKPIIAFFTSVFQKSFAVVKSVFSAIVGAIKSYIGMIKSRFDTIKATVSAVFNAVRNTASNIMDKVVGVFTKVIDKIKDSWGKLKDFVGGIFDGIASNMQDLVGKVKGFVNGVIRGINSAIGLINKIPGVNIGKIPQLYRGTDDFGGGFARMNEGGRGEMVALPSGSKVIPHDVSMKYAKEAGRQQGSGMILSSPNDDGAMIQGAVRSLERTLSNLTMVMDDRVVAQILEKPISEIQDRNTGILNTFRG